VLVKRGDVIPYVIGPVLAARQGDEQPYVPPANCPACGVEVESCPEKWLWYCVNAACPAQLIRNLEHFVSRGAMDIPGLGIRIVEQLVAAGLVRDVADLYSLTREDLLKLEGFADKKADNIISAIAGSKSRSLARVITAIGIRGVGEVGAINLSRRFNSLAELQQASVDELMQSEGIGPNIAQSIVDWFERPTNQNVIEKLRVAGISPQAEKTGSNASQSVLKGLNIRYHRHSTQPQSRSGKTTHRVAWRQSDRFCQQETAYLVLGEDPGSKYDKALSLGVPTLDENGLRQLASSQ
jgi:DNA ligase (NAD+)